MDRAHPLHERDIDATASSGVADDPSAVLVARLVRCVEYLARTIRHDADALAGDSSSAWCLTVEASA